MPDGPSKVNQITKSPVWLLPDRVCEQQQEQDYGSDIQKAIFDGVEFFLVGIGTLAIESDPNQAAVPQQLTPQALTALSACKTVYHYSSFQNELAALLSAANVVDLTVNYDSATNFDQALEGAADFVWNAVLAAKAIGANALPVAYATYGNVLFGDSVSLDLIDRNAALDSADQLALQVIPGVSSFDALAADLLLNAAAGMQIHDAIHLSTYGYGIEPRLPMLILQIDLYSDAISGGPSKVPAPPDRLSNVLKRAYGDGHPVYLKRSYTGKQDIRYHETTVGEIDSFLAGLGGIVPGLTAYVPTNLGGA